MGGGLTFLSKKGFNPANTNNQKAVWEARQRHQLEQTKHQERQDQLKREREEEELAVSRYGSSGKHQVSLRFMYDAPPGLERPSGNNGVSQGQTEEVSGSKGLIGARQPGDDDAAAQFRMLLANVSNGKDNAASSNNHTQPNLLPEQSNGDNHTAETSKDNNENNNKTNTVDTRSSLEKAVGKRDSDKFLSLEEQIQRFPELKNAPMVQGISDKNINVNFKPMGTQFRNIKCLKCGLWGHSRGDRECRLSGWDPFQIKGPFTNANHSTNDTNATNTTVNREIKVMDIPPTDIKNVKNPRSENESSSSEGTSISSDSRRKRKHRKRSHSHRRKHRKRDRHRSKRSHRSHRKERDRNRDKYTKDSRHRHRRHHSPHNDTEYDEERKKLNYEGRSKNYAGKEELIDENDENYLKTKQSREREKRFKSSIYDKTDSSSNRRRSRHERYHERSFSRSASRSRSR